MINRSYLTIAYRVVFDNNNKSVSDYGSGDYYVVRVLCIFVRIFAG